MAALGAEHPTSSGAEAKVLPLNDAKLGYDGNFTRLASASTKPATRNAMLSMKGLQKTGAQERALGRNSNSRRNNSISILPNLKLRVSKNVHSPSVALPGFENVILTPSLRDDLASVGKMCDGGFSILFNACGVKIYSNKGLIVQGSQVLNEKRDRATGLYPITLYPVQHFILTALCQAEPVLALELYWTAIGVWYPNAEHQP